MFLFLLLFHVGGGAAVAGWFMSTRFEHETAGLITLLLGLAGLLIGIAGFTLETGIRMRAQTIRLGIDMEGDWKGEGQR